MKVGIVGWRGMVGSVLLQRMIEENDFSLGFEPVFFTTSQAGQAALDGVQRQGVDKVDQVAQPAGELAQWGVTHRFYDAMDPASLARAMDLADMADLSEPGRREARSR